MGWFTCFNIHFRHWVMYQIEKNYATDTRIRIFIRASVANTQQNKATSKSRNFKLIHCLALAIRKGKLIKA